MTIPSDDTFRRAMAALQAGKINDAERAFRALLRAQPRHVAALNLLSVVLAQLGKFDEAEQFVRRALKENTASDATLYNYGCILKALHRPEEALQQFSRALAINPAAADSWNNRGTVYNDLGRYREAIADFGKAIAINPKYAAVYCNKAKSLAELKSYDQALAAFDRALSIEPNLAAAWGGRGGVLSKLMQYEIALEAYDKAIGLQPDLAAGWLDRANVLSKLGRRADARESYDRALSLNAGLAEAWLGIGNILTEAGRFEDASVAYDRAMAIKPNLAEGWLGRGNLFSEANRCDEAFDAYNRALAIKPGLAEAWLGRGIVFFKLGRHDNAEAAFNQALSLQSDFAAAWLATANNYAKINRFEEATAGYDKALALQPGLAEAWADRAAFFVKRRQFSEALVAYDKALAIKPDLKFTESSRLHVKQCLCNWSNFKHEVALLLTGMRDQKLLSDPFFMLALPTSAADQLQCAKRFVANQPSFPAHRRGEYYAHDRIRIAYISSDLRDHPVGLQMAEVFEQHDKSRFELTAVSLSAAPESETRSRIKGAFEHFVDAQAFDDQKIADYIRQHEIDIAVDLNGFTTGGRPSVLAWRPAPIQVNYLGYPGTLGADYYDYILADRTIIPADQFQFYCEKVVWLPDSYMATESRRRISDKVPARAKHGLPENGFVFCCFNAPYKLSPNSFAVWMRLLKTIEGSVLWLSDPGDDAKVNLRREAERAGVSAERLIFAQRVDSLADHLAREQLADLFLDTLPYNAHATAIDALWTEVPVLTCLGSTFAGRVAASLLDTLGLNELVTATLDDYEAFALKLACDPELLASLKAKLARNRRASPLFDTARFTRHIEAAYTRMGEQYRSDQPPAHFAVDAIEKA